ncbi:hypothetical protein J6590_067396 [Homalodisca vitripennis]|nr:hypothetical protein J6590_067396 [Homalodisca vitripennis]
MPTVLSFATLVGEEATITPASLSVEGYNHKMALSRLGLAQSSTLRETLTLLPSPTIICNQEIEPQFTQQKATGVADRRGVYRDNEGNYCTTSYVTVTQDCMFINRCYHCTAVFTIDRRATTAPHRVITVPRYLPWTGGQLLHRIVRDLTGTEIVCSSTGVITVPGIYHGQEGNTAPSYVTVTEIVCLSTGVITVPRYLPWTGGQLLHRIVRDRHGRLYVHQQVLSLYRGIYHGQEGNYCTASYVTSHEIVCSSTGVITVPRYLPWTGGQLLHRIVRDRHGRLYVHQQVLSLYRGIYHGQEGNYCTASYVTITQDCMLINRCYQSTTVFTIDRRATTAPHRVITVPRYLPWTGGQLLHRIVRDRHGRLYVHQQVLSLYRGIYHGQEGNNCTASYVTSHEIVCSSTGVITVPRYLLWTGGQLLHRIVRDRHGRLYVHQQVLSLYRGIYHGQEGNYCTASYVTSHEIVLSLYRGIYHGQEDNYCTASYVTSHEIVCSSTGVNAVPRYLPWTGGQLLHRIVRDKPTRLYTHQQVSTLYRGIYHRREGNYCTASLRDHHIRLYAHQQILTLYRSIYHRREGNYCTASYVTIT